MKSGNVPAILTAVLLAAACTTTPERIDSLEQARAAVQSASALPDVHHIAPDEMQRARQALDRAETLAADHRDLDLIQHESYLATRYAHTAEALVDATAAEERITGLEDERERIVLEQREREAAAAKLRAASAEQRAAELAVALDALQTEQTPRGTVLTLGDVLFETDRATLKAGAAATMDRLAQFMNDYPERRVLIEGHTDSRGSDDYNRRLSRERADAVRDALVLRGIDAQRIETAGKGEAFPVASNDTQSGRQQNRRVEIVISDADGRLAGA